MKINRYKYTNEKLDITIIEILEEDKIKDFIDINKYINSRDFTNEEIIFVHFKNGKKLECINGLIKQKNNDYYICSIESNKEGIILLKEDLKLIGILNYNNKVQEIEFIPMNIIINNINYIDKIENEDDTKEKPEPACCLIF